MVISVALFWRGCIFAEEEERDSSSFFRICKGSRIQLGFRQQQAAQDTGLSGAASGMALALFIPSLLLGGTQYFIHCQEVTIVSLFVLASENSGFQNVGAFR